MHDPHLHLQIFHDPYRVFKVRVKVLHAPACMCIRGQARAVGCHLEAPRVPVGMSHDDAHHTSAPPHAVAPYVRLPDHQPSRGVCSWGLTFFFCRSDASPAAQPALGEETLLT